MGCHLGDFPYKTKGNHLYGVTPPHVTFNTDDLPHDRCIAVGQCSQLLWQKKGRWFRPKLASSTFANAFTNWFIR